jgi:hypothetical protein
VVRGVSESKRNNKTLAAAAAVLEDSSSPARAINIRQRNRWKKPNFNMCTRSAMAKQYLQLLHNVKPQKLGNKFGNMYI